VNGVFVTISYTKHCEVKANLLPLRVPSHFIAHNGNTIDGPTWCKMGSQFLGSGRIVNLSYVTARMAQDVTLQQCAVRGI
jgi:hypothetical protein